MEALTIKMDSQFQSLKEDMRKNYTNRGDNHASKNSMNDDTPMCERHEANYIQLEGTFLRARVIGLMPMIDQIVGAENPVLMSVAEHIFSAGGKRMRAAFDFEVFGNTTVHSDGAVTTIVKGDDCKSKKEAEQLVARVVILSCLDSESGNDIVDIINCKLSPLVELNKVHEINSVHKGTNVVVPQTEAQIVATTLALPVDKIFCKSIMADYAIKINVEIPTYKTTRLAGLILVFCSSVLFNDVNYQGDDCKSKKEAEQLVACDVILSCLDSESGNDIVDIINC
ncbi:hypothetical protein Tco_0505488, partial [Tanacetum coccineum]